jgi:hypothetical protein
MHRHSCSLESILFTSRLVSRKPVIKLFGVNVYLLVYTFAPRLQLMSRTNPLCERFLHGCDSFVRIGHFFDIDTYGCTSHVDPVVGIDCII